MANHKSALKRVGVSEKKNLRNRMISSAVKTAIKKACRLLDKAASKGVIHKNAANRKKAQLAIKLAAK